MMFLDVFSCHVLFTHFGVAGDVVVDEIVKALGPFIALLVLIYMENTLLALWTWNRCTSILKTVPLDVLLSVERSEDTSKSILNKK